MSTRLVKYRGAKIELAFGLDGSKVTIGRDDDNMIQLPNPKISKHHAILQRTAAGWVIEDLGSKNGISVNGKATERVLLNNMDRVDLGPYQFHFETNVPSDDWVPSHIIDTSAKAHKPTLLDGERSEDC